MVFSLKCVSLSDNVRPNGIVTVKAVITQKQRVSHSWTRLVTWRDAEHSLQLTLQQLKSVIKPRRRRRSRQPLHPLYSPSHSSSSYPGIQHWHALCLRQRSAHRPLPAGCCSWARSRAGLHGDQISRPITASRRTCVHGDCSGVQLRRTKKMGSSKGGGG